VCKGFVSAWKQLLLWFHQWKHQLKLTFVDVLTKWDEWLMNQTIKQVTLF
jgi:hypothetical protein